MGTWTLEQIDEAFILKTPDKELICYAFDGPFQGNSYAIRSTDPADPNRLLKIEGIAFSKDEALGLAHDYAIGGYKIYSPPDSNLDDQTEFAKKGLERKLSISAHYPLDNNQIDPGPDYDNQELADVPIPQRFSEASNSISHETGQMPSSAHSPIDGGTPGPDHYKVPDDLADEV